MTGMGKQPLFDALNKIDEEHVKALCEDASFLKCAVLGSAHNCGQAHVDLDIFTHSIA